MSEAPRGFEQTLEALAQERRRSETDLTERLGVLQERMDRLASAAEESAAQAAEIASRRAPSLPREPTIDAPTDASDATGSSPEDAGAATGGLVRWLLGSRLDELERQQARTSARVDALSEQVTSLRGALGSAVAALREGDEALLVALREQVEGHAAIHTSLRGTLNHAVEAMAALVGVHEGLQLLIDAKDAETLQRAAHGPLRKMEVVFDEFSRQQEALLADLVGRRRHLEALVRGLVEPSAGD